ncbi:MAG: TIR domain-containing protein [Candidatus Poribacteria bacterium]|nr:TIR domain-containing protein [Candidatus Poribacteria bacterium]
MHKVFISYHHANDQSYKDALITLAEGQDVFIDASVDTDDIPDELDDEQIRRTIRDDYLGDSTVTIVLVGTETMHRKHVDWEIYSSMYDGAVNKKSGIIAVMLPSTGVSYVHASHEGERALYPYFEWTASPNSRTEWERRYPYMPARLIDNLFDSNALISVVTWEKATEPYILSTLVEMAFRDRDQCEYNLSSPMRRANS